KLTIAVYGCGVRFLIGGLQKLFEKLCRRGVIMLSVTEKFFQILLQKPVEIADPVEPLRLHDHAESRIGQERAASCSCFSIARIYRDDGFEIAESLLLQAFKTLGDEIHALINGQSNSDARSRQIASHSFSWWELFAPRRFPQSMVPW